jgi:hypothetical protein
MSRDFLPSKKNPLGGLGGKPDKNQETSREVADKTGNYMDILGGISQDYYNQTAGLRGGIINRLTNFLSGNMDPVQSAMYAPIKSNVENQYARAENEILSKLPAGGVMQNELANASLSKAGTLSQLIANLVQDEYNKAYAMGSGSQEVASSGLTNAAGTGSNLINSLANQSNAATNKLSTYLKILGLGM